MVYYFLKEFRILVGSLGGIVGVNLVVLVMVILFVYVMFVMVFVLNFGLLLDFILDYFVLFLNENNVKIFMYYDNWYYFRLYWIIFI